MHCRTQENMDQWMSERTAAAVGSKSYDELAELDNFWRGNGTAGAAIKQEIKRRATK